jgi:uncharacterized protein (TIGR02145 family)
MKKAFTFIILSFFVAVILPSQHALAQPLQWISYQAVVRDNLGHPYINCNLAVVLSILQGSPGGPVVYSEFKAPTTNENGLINCEFNGGSDFLSINWANGPFYLKTEIDPSFGINYTITATSQLLSVPYAFCSKVAENAVDVVKLTGNQTITGNITFTGTTKVQPPVNTTDAATKGYVDALQARIKTLELKDLLTNGVYDSRDGNHYDVIIIGTQVWLAQNLKYLPVVHSNAEFQAMGYNSQPGYGVYGYDGSDVATAKALPNYNSYGVLYNWYAVNTGNLCPTGWHVATEAEWTTLIDFLGGLDLAGGKLKEAGTVHWTVPNIGATNSSKFTALPGGLRYELGSFTYISEIGDWWSATESGTNTALGRFLDYGNTRVQPTDSNKQFGRSVRCIKD